MRINSGSVIARIFWVLDGIGVEIEIFGKNNIHFTIKPVYLHTFAFWIRSFNWKQHFSGGFYPWVVVAPDHLRPV